MSIYCVISRGGGGEGCWKLYKEALDRTPWRTRFGRGYGPVIRQTMRWWLWWWYDKVSVIDNYQTSHCYLYRALYCVRTWQLLSVCCQLLEIFWQNPLNSLQTVPSGAWYMRYLPYLYSNSAPTSANTARVIAGAAVYILTYQQVPAKLWAAAQHREHHLFTPGEKLQWCKLGWTRCPSDTKSSTNCCRLNFGSKNPTRSEMGKMKRRSVLGYPK